MLEIEKAKKVCEAVDGLSVKMTNAGRDIFIKKGTEPGAYLKQRDYGMLLKSRDPSDPSKWILTRIENVETLKTELLKLSLADIRPGNGKFENGKLVTPKVKKEINKKEEKKVTA